MAVANEETMDFIKDKLNEWIATKPIGFLHKKYLIHLRKSHFAPKVIYDIGATDLKWYEIAKEVFPDAEIYIFDASDQFEDMYKDKKYFIKCLSNKSDKLVNWFETKDERIKSYYRPLNYLEDPVKFLTTITLDDLVAKENLPVPDLVKISTCGSELDIINGGIGCLSNAKWLIASLMNDNLFVQGAQKADEAGPMIESYGFERKDTLDNYGTALLDYVFENKKI
jgi:hypothetical protein